jgi:sulfur carrier protein
MQINVNNKPYETSARTMAELATEMNLPDKGVAMALGMQMIQRQEWAETSLSEGCNVLIIKAACGG